MDIETILTEKQFKISLMKAAALDHGAEYQTIETTTGLGVPDAVVKVPGIPEFWIETKRTPNEYGPLLRPMQRVWAYNWAKKGGHVFLCDVFKPEYEMSPQIRGWKAKADSPWEIWDGTVNGKYVRIKEYPHFEARSTNELMKKIIESL